jgi:hypothetical protein
MNVFVSEYLKALSFSEKSLKLPYFVNKPFNKHRIFCVSLSTEMCLLQLYIIVYV